MHFISILILRFKTHPPYHRKQSEMKTKVASNKSSTTIYVMRNSVALEKHIFQTFQGASYVLYSYVGIEALTFLLDETHHPRRRIPTVIPICNGLMSLVFFLVTMVVTLAIDITKLSPKVLLPEIYGVISVPAAR